MALHRLTRRTDMTTSIKIVVAVAAVVAVASMCKLLAAPIVSHLLIIADTDRLMPGSGIIAWRILAWRKKRRAADGTSVEVALPSGSSQTSAGSAIEKGFLTATTNTTDAPTNAMDPSSAPLQAKRSTRPKLPPIPIQGAAQHCQPLPPPAYVAAPPKQQPVIKATVTPIQTTNCNAPQLESPVRKASFHPPTVKPSTYRRPMDKKLCDLPSLPSCPCVLIVRRPRLMTVAATYTPTLSDELPIKVGEIVRMIEEYEDEWCLVQHVGRTDDKKGVCPRFCLLERQDIIPRRKMGPSVMFPVSTSAFPVSTYYK